MSRENSRHQKGETLKKKRDKSNQDGDAFSRQDKQTNTCMPRERLCVILFLEQNFSALSSL